MARFFKLRSVRVLLVAFWLLAGFVLSQLIAVGIFWLVSAFFTVDAVNAVVLTTVLSALVYILALLLVVGVMWWIRRWSLAALYQRLGLQRRVKIKDLGLALLGYVPYIAVSLLIITLATILLPGFNVEEQQELGFDSLANNFEFILAFIALVILAPIAEELLFRGYLFGTLRRLLSFWPTAIIVSALFGLVHGQWNVAIDTFALSIILCWLREYTGAVWASIFLHMIKNGLAFSLLFVV